MSNPKLTQPYCADDCVNVRRGAADEIERLRGDLEVMRLQRNATHCSRCPECAKEFVHEGERT